MTIRRSILLAEDEPNDVFLLKHAFAQADVQNPMFVATSGQEAIDYLSGTGQFSDRVSFPFPSLLILDFKMPRKNGLEVLQWLQRDERLRCLPTMMFSSSAHPDDVEEAYRLGVNAFVVKPLGVESRSRSPFFVSKLLFQ